MQPEPSSEPVGRRYPRRCAGCGAAFTTARRDARFCSSGCRRRAWRAARRRTAVDGTAALGAQVAALQAALQQAQHDDVCAVHGCRLTTDSITGTASTARQAAELERLRAENTELRRWVARRLASEAARDRGR